MADVFLSYRNTPDRRIIVRRLATILRAHEISVWWDYGLEAGESYRAQITAELASARVVSPLWCAESIQSTWVRLEAELGKDKLVPARLQKVVPPDDFEAIHAADLIGWDGAVGSPRLLEFVRLICKRLGRPALAPTDMIEDLGQLPAVAPLPEVAIAASPTSPASAAPIAQPRSERTLAPHVETTTIMPFGEAHFPASEPIRVDAPFIQADAEGLLVPGNGVVEWFRDAEFAPEMVVVPARSFLMGSPQEEEGRNDDGREGSQRLVTISMPFAIGRTAVTVAEFSAFISACGWSIPPTMWTYESGRALQRNRRSYLDPGFEQTEAHPVVGVNWSDANAYCRWLSSVTGKSYRLPSEAEWEYCCRAGTTTAFWFGDRINADLANYNAQLPYRGTVGGEFRKQTLPARHFQPNPWGLFQTHGNVCEWCADAWHPDYASAPADAQLREGGDERFRILRGGSWYLDPRFLRSANRYGCQPDLRISDVGFRVARTL